MTDFPWISSLVLPPLIGGLFLVWRGTRATPLSRGLYFGVSAIPFIVFVFLLAHHESAVPGIQFSEHIEFLPFGGALWDVGIDGLSLWLVGLTALLTPLGFMASHFRTPTQGSRAIGFALLLESALLGALVSRNLALFSLFWALTLLAIHKLCRPTDRTQSEPSDRSFLVYSMASLGLLLGCVIYLAVHAKGLSFSELAATTYTRTEQCGLFIVLVMSFAVLVPLTPLQGWFSRAYRQLPNTGAVLLLGATLKLGVYGILVIAIPLFPSAMGILSPYLLLLAVMTILYGTIGTGRASDLKSLVGYASVGHMGLILLGVVTFTELGTSGAIMHMIGHGLSVGLILLLVKVFRENQASLQLTDFSGLGRESPGFAALLALSFISLAGMPLTSGFIGEWMILSGAFYEALPIDPSATQGLWATVTSWPYLVVGAMLIAAFSVVMMGTHLILAAIKVLVGSQAARPQTRVFSSSRSALIALLPLLALIFAIGIVPQFFLKPITPSVSASVEQSYTTVSRIRNPGQHLKAPKRVK